MKAGKHTDSRSEENLTISGDSACLEKSEAVSALKRGNLARGKLGEEFGLFVVLVVLVRSWLVELEPTKSSGCFDLKESRASLAIKPSNIHHQEVRRVILTH